MIDQLKEYIKQHLNKELAQSILFYALNKKDYTEVEDKELSKYFNV